jgi:hypothetical protein
MTFISLVRNQRRTFRLSPPEKLMAVWIVVDVRDRLMGSVVTIGSSYARDPTTLLERSSTIGMCFGADNFRVPDSIANS